MKIYFAPLEGITTHLYRNIYEKYYGHIDKYFAPFISPAENCPMTPKERKDLLPENNKGIYLVPQIITCKSGHFIEAAKELKDMGYSEINLNLGCPSGTVCAKKKGAGFLSIPNELESFLDDIYSFGNANNIKISVKTRLGYADPDEFYDLLNIFNKFPISELIIHPRIRSDFYKGESRFEYYKYAIKNSKNPIVYNGNIFAKEDYDALCSDMDLSIDTIMLGRGLVGNPSLNNALRTGNTEIDYKSFWEMHDSLYNEYKKILSPDINVLYRMKELWSLWKLSFEGHDKEMKAIIKAKKCVEFENVIQKLR